MYKRQIYQIGESNRIEKIDSVAKIESNRNFFCLNWNALLTRQSYTADFAPVRNSQWVLPVFIVEQNLVGIWRYMYYYAEAAETFIKCRQQTTKYYNTKKVLKNQQNTILPCATVSSTNYIQICCLITFTPVLIEGIRYLDIIRPMLHLFIVVSTRVTVLSLFQLPSFPPK